MPNISEFRAPALRIQPSEIGVEATAAAGRRAGAFYNQAGESIANMGARFGRAGAALGDVVVAHEDHAQINAGAAHGTEVYDNLMQSKDEAIKGIDPNDPAYGPKVESAIKQWREETVEPALQQFREGFTTQKSLEWADHFVNTTRDHMFKHSVADISDAAGIGVKNSVSQTVSRASNLALRNPETVDDQLELLKHSIDGIVDSSPMKGIAAAKIRGDVYQQASDKIVKAGAFGAIRNSSDPEATAEQWIKKYPQYIDGSEARTFAQAAKAQAKSNLLTQKQLEQYQKQQNVDAAHTQSNKVFSDNVSYDDTTGRIDIKPAYFKQAMDIARMPNAPEGLARTLINWGEAQQRARKEAIITDPATKKTLYDGLFSADNPTTEIALMKAQIDGKLSNQDFQQLHNLYKVLEEKPLKGPFYQGTMKGVENILGTDPVGHEKFTQFIQKFIPLYLSLPPDQQAKALKIDDPNSLLSQTMSPLKRTPLQMILDKRTYGLIEPGAAAMALSTPAAAPAAPAEPPQKKPIPDRAVQMLKNNPSMRAEFDAKYGAGQADKILGVATSAEPAPVKPTMTPIAPLE